MLYLLSGIGVCDTTVINFENLPGNGIVNNQYSDLGVTFNDLFGTHNYYPAGFVAHSGSYYVGRFVNMTTSIVDPIEIRFQPDVSRIKLWVGYILPFGIKSGTNSQETVVMSAYDDNGNSVGQDSAIITIGPQGYSSIQTPLEIQAPITTKSNAKSAIAKVTIGLSDGKNNGLCIDDVEFDTPGAPLSPKIGSGG